MISYQFIEWERRKMIGLDTRSLISRKMRIYKNNKLIEGTEIITKEYLIPARLLIAHKASEKFGFRNVWTINGDIFAKTSNGVQKI